MKRVFLFFIFLFCLTACKTLPDTIPVTSVTISQPTAEMIEGETVQLKAIVQPENATDKAVLWASSKQSVATISENGLVTAIAEGTSTITAIAGGKTGSCQVIVSKRVIAISLNKEELELIEGDSYILVATVYPYNATDKTVIWSSSNTSVARVYYSGVVIAVSPGTTTITATTNDGGFTATCKLTVYATHEAVDLGLTSRLKWATCNVGANAPTEYGDYFAWGEIAPYYSSQDPLTWKGGKSDGYYWSSYQWSNGFENTLTKYNRYKDYGLIDNKTVLDLEDDAAHANWGGKWRMPIYEEWVELERECTWKKTALKGVYGRLVTGPNGNSIFLPAAGYRSYTDLRYAGSYGYYWSSSLYDDPHDARYMCFYPTYSANGYTGRYIGHSVRPVTE